MQDQPARRHTQARGRARREALLETARTMLEEADCASLTLPAIAESAGIPASSAYHFYPEINELYKELARAIAHDMIALCRFPAEAADWQTIVADFLRFSAAYFNDHAAARQLMLGMRIAPEIKQAACWEDYRFGKALLGAIGRQFALPPRPDMEEICFKAIQIADFFFSLSVMERGSVTPAAEAEGRAAMTAYLGLYLPHFLPRRDEIEPENRTGSRLRTPAADAIPRPSAGPRTGSKSGPKAEPKTGTSTKRTGEAVA